MRRAHIALLLCAVGLVLCSSTAARAGEAVHPTFAGVERGVSAADTYATNAFAIVHEGQKGVGEPDTSWRAVRGLVYREAVERDAFFNLLGRPDLASQFRRRRALGNVLKWTGYTAAVSGLFVTLVGLGDGSGVVALVGLSGLIGGAITREIGESVRKPVFPEVDAIDMAARYNESLRAHLGLPPEPPPPVRVPPARGGNLAVTLLPLLVNGGAGLAAGGRF